MIAYEINVRNIAVKHFNIALSIKKVHCEDDSFIDIAVETEITVLYLHS